MTIHYASTFNEERLTAVENRLLDWLHQSSAESLNNLAFHALRTLKGTPPLEVLGVTDAYIDQDPSGLIFDIVCWVQYCATGIKCYKIAFDNDCQPFALFASATYARVE